MPAGSQHQDSHSHRTLRTEDTHKLGNAVVVDQLVLVRHPSTPTWIQLGCWWEACSPWERHQQTHRLGKFRTVALLEGNPDNQDEAAVGVAVEAAVAAAGAVLVAVDTQLELTCPMHLRLRRQEQLQQRLLFLQHLHLRLGQMLRKQVLECLLPVEPVSPQGRGVSAAGPPAVAAVAVGEDQIPWN